MRERAWASTVLGAICVAAAFTLYFSMGDGAGDHSRPVALSISPNGQWVSSRPFRPQEQGNYIASLWLRRRYPDKEMECLADVGIPDPANAVIHPPNDCPPALFPASLQWTLIEDGHPVAQTLSGRDHLGGGDAARISRWLGTYSLDRRRTYVVRARFINAPPTFAATAPILDLQFADLPSLIVKDLLFSFGSLLLGVLGGWLIFKSQRRIWRGRA